MKKFFTFLTVGVFALVLSAVAVGQMKKARTPYGAPPKVVANGEMLSAKVQKADLQKGESKKKQRGTVALTEAQKIKAEKLSKAYRKKNVAGFSYNSQKPVMRLQSVASYESDVNAKITLDVQVDWGDGSGYQVLLDADHSSYGVDFDDVYIGIPEDCYDVFEYKIPADAAPSSDFSTGGCVCYGEQKSLEIPAGVYDYAVVNPTPSAGMIYIPSGSFSVGDDYAFEAGKEYFFTIIQDGVYDNCILTVPTPVDMSVTDIVIPLLSTGFTSAETITAKVANNGTDAISSFNMKLTVDDREIATEQVSRSLESGAETEYSFSAKADLSAIGSHKIKVEVVADGDGDASNNAVEKAVSKVVAVEPPFVCDFSSPTDMDKWYIFDANYDQNTWVYDEMSQCAVLNYSSISQSDDYLITPPIMLSAGDAYVTFSYCSLSGYFPERLQLLYGKVADPENMQVIWEKIDFVLSENEQQVINLNIDEAGEYYFAFYGCSTADQYGVTVDDVEIASGKYVSAPDLSLDKVILPMSSTALSSAESIKVEVSNPSFGAIEKFGLSYKINGGSSVSQEFGSLAPGESKVFEFDEKADFSAEGVYEVSVITDYVVSELAEENSDNNTGTATVQHYAPATVPFTVDFSDETQRADWAYEEGAWVYNADEGAMQSDAYNIEQALKSRGVSLEGGKSYRFTFNFCAGYDLFGLLTVGDSFDVVYGIDGTPMEDWKVLKSYENVYTQEVYYDERINVACEQSGVYSFAIVPTSPSGYFFISSASVTELMPYDVAMVSVEAPTLLPLAQAGKFPVTATVLNNGSSVVEATVVVKNGDVEVGRAEAGEIAVGASVEVDVDVNIADAVVGSVVSLEAVATIDGHESDDTSDDNSASKQITVTEEELGYDYVTEDMYIGDNCIGVEGGAIGCGVPFHLAAEDVLTGISVGWGAVVEQEIMLAVYEYDPATGMLGKEIVSEVVPQGSETGQVVYDISSPRKLDAGDYMVSVVFQNYCLVTNMNVPGMLYLTSNNPVGMQNNLGTPAIRSVFGEGEVVAKDAVVVGFSKPADKGLFSANEPVVVSVKNDGSEEIAGTLALSINGEDAGSQPIALGGYASSEIAFEADLSKPGEYVLEAVASVEGDENPDNNSASKTVVSVEPADPYIMDFEQCEDFATSGFNPAWRTVDVDGNYIYGFKDVAFPIPADGKAAYIIFNPAMTTPSLAGDLAIAPNSGERFAACFGASDQPSGVAQNNDWLISPKLALPLEDAAMSFFVKSYSDMYGLEKYNVLVSETDDNLESFEMIGTTREAPAGAWTEVNVDLSGYAGKDVYLAIQCVSEDVFIFMLDDITVSKGDASVAENAVAMLSLYPNPATDMIVISSGGSEIESVDIYNAAGAMIYSSQASDGNSFRYNVSSLDAGIYFAKVATSDGTKVMRFIVK